MMPSPVNWRMLANMETGDRYLRFLMQARSSMGTRMIAMYMW